jgi:hypothetical protein
MAGMDAPEVGEYHTTPYHTIPYQSPPSSESSFFSQLPSPICAKSKTNNLLLVVRGRAQSIAGLLTITLNKGRHFGRPAQPFYTESLAWLKENIEGRRIKCELLRRDQYERVVALPLLPRSFWPRRHSQQGWGTTTATTRNLPLEMIRAGWGVVYTQKAAEYGSGWEKETYLAAEAEAQSVPFSFLFVPPSFPILFLSFFFIICSF